MKCYLSTPHFVSDLEKNFGIGDVYKSVLHDYEFPEI
jgi:hypothetical protein